MPAVGDKVRVLPNKAGQPPREGVVTARSGNMMRVKWSTGEETSLIPGPGAVTVLGKVRAAPGKKAAPAAKETGKETKSSAVKASKPAKRGANRSGQS